MKKRYKKLSIIIPIYNEDRTVDKLINKVLHAKILLKKEIICIDDGSKDNSVKKLKKFRNKIHLIVHKKNQGKGAAIRTGIKYASGDIIIIQDADLEYEPSEYTKLITPIIKGESYVVYGSRYLSPVGHLKENNHLTFEIHKLGNHGLSLLTTILYGHYITDMETCYKVFDKDIIKKINIKANKFEFEPEVTAKILRQGIKIMELPIKYYSRDFNEGKKITWRDGIMAAWYLIKYRFVN
ncbi:TPA: glycosyltransferase family 2 protein [Candidatus Woesearchaeota archaeon]|nr:hypothetical protein [uncultured archaeon]MBS3172820.1 glycosyltransferase family 2 protein [Candidatus Woesearchaeota archaeon]HIH32360.1 glycosyltransferase family 2 protein [Candidatus Woesearchaeota archaeon]HIH54541.1 glycosyltransferase family 2 protein [Candidatus Woesearchaeota archaeon]HIJ02237.1 glycosyltransferase family 2 protein [Candidatus Woesearchaeota archaeon]